MTTLIEIDGGLVNVVDRVVRSSVPLSEWLPKIERRSPVYTPILPSGCRAVWWDPTDLANQKLMVLIELQPMVINMDLNGTIHRLSIPWTRFFFYARTNDPRTPLAWRLENYRIFWSNRRFDNETTQDMQRAFLPNVYDDGRICFGSTAANADQSLADRLDQTVNEFYATQFNLDLHLTYPNNGRGYRTWERMTETNPMGWTAWSDWTNPRFTQFSFNDLCERYHVAGADRQLPVVVADAIPEVPMGATFGRISEWLATMDNGQRARLLEATLQYRALDNEAFEAPEVTDEEEDD